jgi:RNA polymerase sigma factor (sigma-70 family)
MKFTDEELKRALTVANKFAMKWTHTSLGAEDYASTAIEKLLQQKEKPENIEAWLKMVITNMMIDRHKKLKARKPSLRDLSPEEIQAMAVGRNDRSLTSLLAIKDQVADILDALPDKEQQLLVLDAAGFTTKEIAEELGYASAKVVATRIKQVRKKLKESIFTYGSR